MRLKIAEDVLALFPDALIGVVRVDGCDNAGQDPEIAALLRQAEAGARAAFAGAALAEEPRIACWRAAYRAFGASPKKSPSSIENLLRRVVKNYIIQKKRAEDESIIESGRREDCPPGSHTT